MSYIFILMNFLFFSPYFPMVNAADTILAPRQLLTLQHELEIEGKKVNLVIHYRENQKFLAQRTLDIAKSYFPKIHEYFNYVPQTQVHFVYEEVSRDSNGSAQVFPYNIIRLQDYPPTGDSSLIASHDWLKNLIIHEYIHIVTLEMTRGWMDSLRTVFGSTVKFAALNPRWFLEGIATWGESYFTDEGRLYHPSIINMVVSLLKDPDFCSDLSCWDTPKQFPHGSMAYWIGAHFLNYVETEKKNTLSCWAEVNSRSIPFFVNDRFTQCFGRDIYNAFFDFKTEFLKKYDDFNCPFTNINACEALKKFRTNHNDFKGVLENSNYAVTMINLGKKGSGTALRAEQLFLFDIKKNKATRIIFPQTVEQLYSPEENSFLVSFFNASYIDGLRIFAEFNIETKKLKFFPDTACVDKEEKRFHVVTYIFPQDEKSHVCVRYMNQQWEIGLEQNQQWNPLYHFPKGQQIYRPQIDKKDNQLTLNYFEQPVLANVSLKNMGVFSKPISVIKNLPDASVFQHKDQVDLPLAQEETYSPFSYFYPNYLLLEYLSSGTVDSYGLSTSFSDPRGRHELNTLLLFNSGLDDDHGPLSGLASYTYLPSYLPNLNWLTQAFYSKLRFQFPQEGDARQRVQEESGVLVNYDWIKTLWKFSLGLKASRMDESDPYASRKIEKLALTTNASYLNNAPSTYLKTMSNNLELGNANNIEHDSYLYAIFFHKQIWQWNQDWRTILSYNYGKMFFNESDLTNGTFYGGGIPTVFTISFPFPTYLLGYGSLLGSEMITGQWRQDWTFSYPFSGNGLVPFYLKSIGAIAGMEYLHGDKMFYNLITENDPRLWVGFVGAKFASQLFYLLPVDIELVYAKSLDEKRTRSNLSLMFQANITF